MKTQSREAQDKGEQEEKAAGRPGAPCQRAAAAAAAEMSPSQGTRSPGRARAFPGLAMVAERPSPTSEREAALVAFRLCSWEPGVMTNLDSHLEGDEKPRVGNGKWQARSLAP